MALHHIRLDHANPQRGPERGDHAPAWNSAKPLFRTPEAGWHRRLYRAALVVTTVAPMASTATLVVDHQTMRFSLLYNGTWPEPVFLDIQRWPYRRWNCARDAPVAFWRVELTPARAALGPDEWVEFVFWAGLRAG